MNVLITAGGTLAPVDDVRIISNRSTGRFASSLAEAWLDHGANVSYLATTTRTIGPLEIPSLRLGSDLDPQKVCRKFLEGLSKYSECKGILCRVDLEQGTVADYAETLRRLAQSCQWDVVMLAAAVSDYEPVPVSGKISSDQEEITLRLRRTPKVIRMVRDWIGPESMLIGFKLTSGADDRTMESIAREVCRSNRADATIANDQSTLNAGGHRVAIVEKSCKTEWFEPGEDLAKRVVDRLIRMKAGD